MRYLGDYLPAKGAHAFAVGGVLVGFRKGGKARGALSRGPAKQWPRRPPRAGGGRVVLGARVTYGRDLTRCGGGAIKQRQPPDHDSPAPVLSDGSSIVDLRRAARPASKHALGGP